MIWEANPNSPYVWWATMNGAHAVIDLQHGVYVGSARRGMSSVMVNARTFAACEARLNEAIERVIPTHTEAE